MSDHSELRRAVEDMLNDETDIRIVDDLWFKFQSSGPDTVLELLDEIDQLKAENRLWSALAEAGFGGQK